MRDDPDPDPKPLTICQFCPQAMAFLTSLAQGVSLAQHATGTCPEISGIVRLSPCPLHQHCLLDWSTRGGRVSLLRNGRRLAVQALPTEPAA